MLLGLTYAQFVAVVGGAMVAFDGHEPVQADASRALVSIDHVYKNQGLAVKESMLSVELRPAQEWIWGFKPVYAVGAATDNSAYASLGVRKDYHFGNVQVTPFLGPALYQSKLGTFKGNELLQFRTGFDVIYNMSPNVGFGVGVYHISNAQITKHSADKDMRRLTLQIKF